MSDGGGGVGKGTGEKLRAMRAAAIRSTEYGVCTFERKLDEGNA